MAAYAPTTTSDATQDQAPDLNKPLPRQPPYDVMCDVKARKRSAGYIRRRFLASVIVNCEREREC